MTQRRQTPITMWRQVKDQAPVLDWSIVERRLTDAEDYWLVTSSAANGQPAPRPVWGLWWVDHLLLTVGSSTHWRNMVANERVAVHLPDAHEVVVVEGRAATVTDPAVLTEMVEVYNPKYGWDFPPGEPGTVLRVDPDVVLAWETAPNAEAKQSTFPLAAARWVFDRP